MTYKKLPEGEHRSFSFYRQWEPLISKTVAERPEGLEMTPLEELLLAVIEFGFHGKKMAVKNETAAECFKIMSAKIQGNMDLQAERQASKAANDTHKRRAAKLSVGISEDETALDEIVDELVEARLRKAMGL